MIRVNDITSICEHNQNIPVLVTGNVHSEDETWDGTGDYFVCTTAKSVRLEKVLDISAVQRRFGKDAEREFGDASRIIMDHNEAVVSFELMLGRKEEKFDAAKLQPIAAKLADEMPWRDVLVVEIA